MSLLARFKTMDLVQEMNLALFWCALFSAMGGISFGIDYSYWSGLLGMAQFQKDFGSYDPKTQTWAIPASLQSAGSGLPIAGLAVGSLASGWVGNAVGRVGTLQSSTILVLIGVLIQSTTFKSYWQLTMGRTVNAVGLGTMANCIPTYLAEIAPYKIRGTLVNFYQASMGIGGLIASCVTWATYNWTTQWSYRTVILIQFIIPVGFLTATLYLPESPRWLIGKGRGADAERSLSQLRPHMSLDDLQRETALILAQEEDNKIQFSGSWVECFKGTNLRRTMIVSGVQCLQQAQGNSYMSSYRILFFQALGFKDVFKLNVLFMFEMIMSCCCAFYLADRFGRRPILAITAFLIFSSMFITTGVATSSLVNSPTAMKGTLACMFTWDICSNFGWSSCVWMVTAETASLQLREKTIMIGTFTGFCVSVLVTFVSPFIQAVIGPKIGYVFGGISIVAFFWVVFFLPETGSRSLEELDELFQNQVSPWKFKKYRTRGYGARLAVIEGRAAGDDDLKEQELGIDGKDVDVTIRGHEI